MEYNITYRKKDKGIQTIISYKLNGQWKQKSKQGFEDSRKGKKAAKEWADNALQALKKYSSINADYLNITFGEYANNYLDHIRLKYAKNTIEMYEYAIKYFDSICTVDIKKLTNLHFQNCIDILIKKGFSENSISSYLDKINAILNNAVMNDVLLKNPCKIKVKKTKPKKTALTTYELEDLLNKIKEIDRSYYIASLLAGKCGLRRGEILGLTWDNITEHSILIEKQWKQNTDKSWGFGKLKSINSYREIPISNNIYKELQHYKKCLKSINIYNRVLNYKTYTSLSKLLPRYYRKIGYDISIHELRHTYTTILLMQGIDPKTVSNLIGDDMTQVMKTYSHVTDEMKNKAKKIIENIF